MRLLRIIAACVLIVPACGPRDSNDTAMVPPPVLRYEGADFAFTGPAETTAGPAAVRLVNKGSQLHHAVVARLDSGKTLDDILSFYQDQVKDAPPWLTFVGGPGIIAPGDSIDVVTWFEPGSYALICFVDFTDMVSHFKKGMITALTVRPGTGSNVEVPAAQVEIRTRDYAFELSKPLTTGTQTVRVVSDGPQVHDLVLIQLNEGVTTADFLGALAPGAPPGPPPGRIIGGIGGLSTGQQAVWTVTLGPGHYAMICAVPDREDGAPHFAHGMIHEFTL